MENKEVFKVYLGDGYFGIVYGIDDSRVEKFILKSKTLSDSIKEILSDDSKEDITWIPSATAHNSREMAAWMINSKIKEKDTAAITILYSIVNSVLEDYGEEYNLPKMTKFRELMKEKIAYLPEVHYTQDDEDYDTIRINSSEDLEALNELEF